MTDEANALAELLGQKQERPATTAVHPKPPAPKPSLRDFVPITLGLIVSSIWVFTSAHGIGWAIGTGAFTSSLGEAGIDFLANLVIFGGLLGISIVLARLTPIGAEFQPMGSSRAAGLGSALGIGGLLLTAMQAWVGGHVHGATPSTPTGPLLLITGSLMTLFEAATEELFFRGWLQTRLDRLIGPTGAVAVAALAFSALHIFGGVRSTIALANIFIAGLLFGLLFLRSRNIFASIMAHFGWNWTETILLGLSPNPGAPAYGSIWDFDLSGSSLWGGSTEGLNASLPVTLVLTALILPLLAIRPRTQSA